MRMNCVFLIALNEAYDLRKDDLQWIISKKGTPRTTGKPRYTRNSYTRLGREGIQDQLRRLGILPTQEAIEFMAREVPSKAEVLADEKALIRKRLAESQ